MQASSGFLPQLGAHLSEAGLCATCHTLFTPVLDADGELADGFDPFPEQVPYLEWQHGRFGDGQGEHDQSCQDCHTPDAEAAAVLPIVPAGLNARSPFSRHQFLGGNVFMLRMLQDNIGDLGLRASAENFNDAIGLNTTFLQNDTAGLAIEEVDLGESTLSLVVEVSNKSGHKFPTGFPSRQAWLHVTVTDGNGAVAFESGAPQAGGGIAGNDADADATAVEPHYDLIESADQVQICQSILENTDGGVTYTLLRAATCRKDNRLLPEGFDKATADEDFAVLGAAAGDNDFVGGGDRVSYVVDVVGASGPFTVTAELLFASLSYQTIEDLRTDDGELVQDFVTLYDAADKTPVTVATAELTVE